MDQPKNVFGFMLTSHNVAWNRCKDWPGFEATDILSVQYATGDRCKYWSGAQRIYTYIQRIVNAMICS